MRLAVDVDSHEMVPVNLWEAVFGEELAPYAHVFRRIRLLNNATENNMVRDDLAADTAPIDTNSVWSIKGPDAPSAIDLDRRAEVLDVQGISRQLVYPTMGAVGYVLLSDPAANANLGFGGDGLAAHQAGRTLIELHNRWAAEISRRADGRIRPVGIVIGETVDEFVEAAERMLADGVRAVMISAGTPPAGLSPADPRLDPFWGLLAEAKAPALHHVTVERGLLASTAWAVGVEEFRPAINSSAEFHIEPWRTATLSMATQNYLATMILGGVFERHPDLRFGAAELTAGWVGPFAENLDDVVRQFGSRYRDYAMLPSERIRNNVRVAPFPFEPLDRYLERYPVTQDVICYCSDFPHKEGGTFSKQLYLDRVGRFGPDVVDRFFTGNGSLLLPD